MKPITISLDVAELVYDIQNKTYLTGKSRHDGSNHHQVANMQANDDDENANQILRSIEMAFAMLKTKLSEYLHTEESGAGNNPTDTAEPFTLNLLMPSNYNTSTVKTIAEAAHRYVTSSAIADWFTITNKTDASDYSKTAANCLTIISEAAHKRLRPKRNAG